MATLILLSDLTISGTICIGVEMVTAQRLPAAISSRCWGSMVEWGNSNSWRKISATGSPLDPKTNRQRRGISL